MRRASATPPSGLQGPRLSAYDLVVVGGGPAGCTLAALFKRLRPSSKVLLLEKAAFPRHHIGESLLPAIIPVLKELGVFDKIQSSGFLRKIGATFVWGRDRRPWDADFSQAKFELMSRYGKGADLELTWQVERSRYDALLLEHAAACGVEVCSPAAALRPLMRGRRVTGLEVEAGGRRFKARSRMLADCSGQQGFLSKSLLRRRYFDELRNVAFYGYFRGAEWKFRYTGQPDKTRIFICSVPEGWLWYIPIAQDLVSVGLVSKSAYVKKRGVADPRAYFLDAVRACGEVAPLLSKAELAKGMDPADPGKDFFSVSDWSFQSGAVSGPGWVAAGDAAFFIDPILSSGVMMAHLGAQRAAYTLNTLWDRPSGAVAKALWDDYGRFCGEVGWTFLAMAEYWYHHEPNAKAWKGRARAAAGLLASLDLDDQTMFTSLISGAVHQFEQSYADRTWMVSGMGDDQGRPSKSWRYNASRDLPVLGLFLNGPNASSWEKPAAPRRRPPPPPEGSSVPEWTLNPASEPAFLPVAGRGVLRPIRSVRFGVDPKNPGFAPRRLLPASYALIVDLVDGRRTAAEIKRAAASRLALPIEVVERQAEQLFSDLASIGALAWGPAKTGPGRPLPPAPEGLRLLRDAETACKTGRLGEAESLASMAIEAGAPGPWPWCLRADLRRRLGRPADARSDFERALRPQPTAAAAGLKGLSADFEAAILRGWLLDRAHAGLAELASQAGDWKQVLEHAELALELSPGQPDAERLRTLARGRLGLVSDPAPAS